MKQTPNIELEIDDKLNGILQITCPECQTKIKKKLNDLSSGKVITCICNASITISNDGCKSAQKNLDELKQALKKFGT